MINNQQKQVIREMAYYKWERAGQPLGDDLKFWLEAEKERFGDRYDGPAFYTDIVEEALQETFPASDSASWMMTTVGVHPRNLRLDS